MYDIEMIVLIAKINAPAVQKKSSSRNAYCDALERL